MSNIANVRSVQALIDYRSGMPRFGSEAQASIRIAEHEVRRTEEWLQERLTYWQSKVQRQQEALRQAEAALARCRASGYRDERGYYHAPDCSAYEQAVFQAKTRIQKAQNGLNNVQLWIRQVNQVASTYRVQARQMSRVLQADLHKGIAFLGEKINELQAYLDEKPYPTGSSSTQGSVNTGSATSSWVDTGIQPVSPDRVDVSDSPVTSMADFRKVPGEEMAEGMRKLEDIVAPVVA